MLGESAKRGLSINEGIAIDARLVKSASKSLSNDALKKLREHRSGIGGKEEEGRKPLEFTRNVESDWTVKKDKPHFGLRELAYRARFTTMAKNLWDTMCKHMAFNLFRGSKLLVGA